jgi:hypothetical protein
MSANPFMQTFLVGSISSLLLNGECTTPIGRRGKTEGLFARSNAVKLKASQILIVDVGQPPLVFLDLAANNVQINIP